MIKADDLQPLLANPQLSICGQGPSKDFQSIVEIVWSFSGLSPDRAVFEILPDSNFDLVFLLGESRCSALFSGPYTRRVVLPLNNEWELVSVRFRPGAVPRLADVRPSEMVNGGVFLSQVLGVAPDYFGERFKSLADIGSRRSFLEDTLRASGLAEAIPQSRSRECFALIESRAGLMTVGELSRETSMSVRTLERIFMDEVGLTPKRVLRYFRYQTALRGLRSRMFRTQADLAYECGYSDQSHFINDFHFFSGKSPGQF